MRWLELKIPPPLVALLVACAMWIVARHSAPLELPAAITGGLSIVLALAGAALDLVGIASFLRARTTIHPMRPERSAALVERGAYRFTRNPMYVGLALLLTAWALWLSSAWALLGVAAFVAYITRFQIIPEERVLSARFGAGYAQYCARVRRWL